MFIVEVALQGVAGFPPLVRLSLEPGVNVARTECSRARRALVDVVYHTLYPDPARHHATVEWVDPDAEDSRVAVTFFGRDRMTYRLIRNLRTGGVNLYRFEAERQKYRLLTQAVTEAAQFVRVQQQLPDDIGYERLFVYAPESMPSQKDAARTRSGHPVTGSFDRGPSAPGLPVSPRRSISAMVVSGPPEGRSSSIQSVLGPSVFSGRAAPAIHSVLAERSLDEHGATARSPDALRAELARWRTQLDQVKDAEDTENELDRLQRRKTELVEVVRSAGLLRDELDDLRRQLEAEGVLAELPRGFAERLRVHEQREMRYQNELARFDKENDRLRRELAAASVVPLIRDPYFVLGIGAAVLFIAAAAILVRPWIALLNIPAAFIAAAGALRYIADREHRYRAGLRVKAAEDHRDRVEKQHRLDTAVVTRMLKRSGVDSAAMLRDRVQRYEVRRASYEQARVRLEQLLADGSVDRAEQEAGRLEQQIETLERRVVGLAVHEPAATLERRILDLEAELESVLGSSTEEPAASTDPEPPAVSTRDARPGPTLPAFPDPPPARPTDPPPSPSLWRERPAVAGPRELPPPRPPPRSLIDRSRSGVRVTPATEPGSDALGQFSAYVVRRTPESVPEPPGLESEDRAPPFTTSSGLGSVATDSLFDFEGGALTEDDEEDGYGTGYGSPSSSPGEPDSKLRSAGPCGWWAASAGGGSGGFGDGTGAPSGGDGGSEPRDRSRELVESARAVLQVPVGTLAAKLQVRMGQYLAALTERRYARVQFSPRGAIRVGPKGSGALERYIDLTPDVVDEVDAAIRFCLAEAILRERHVPILVDDPFIELDARRRKLLGQMIQYLGRATQVFVVTPGDGIEGHPISW